MKVFLTSTMIMLACLTYGQVADTSWLHYYEESIYYRMVEMYSNDQQSLYYDQEYELPWNTLNYNLEDYDNALDSIEAHGSIHIIRDGGSNYLLEFNSYYEIFQESYRDFNLAYHLDACNLSDMSGPIRIDTTYLSGWSRFSAGSYSRLGSKFRSISETLEFDSDIQGSQVTGSIKLKCGFVSDYEYVKITKEDIGKKITLGEHSFTIINIIGERIITDLDKTPEGIEMVNLTKEGFRISESESSYGSSRALIPQKIYEAFEENKDLTLTEFRTMFHEAFITAFTDENFDGFNSKSYVDNLGRNVLSFATVGDIDQFYLYIPRYHSVIIEVDYDPLATVQTPNDIDSKGLLSQQVTETSKLAHYEKATYHDLSEMFKPEEQQSLNYDEEYELPWNTLNYNIPEYNAALDSIQAHGSIQIIREGISNNRMEFHSYHQTSGENDFNHNPSLLLHSSRFSNRSEPLRLDANSLTTSFVDGTSEDHDGSKSWYRMIKSIVIFDSEIQENQVTGSAKFELGLISDYAYVKITKADIGKKVTLGNYTFTIINIIGSSIITDLDKVPENMDIVNLTKNGYRISQSEPCLESSSTLIPQNIYMAFAENKDLTLAEFRSLFHESFMKAFADESFDGFQSKKSVNNLGRNVLIFSTGGDIDQAYLYIPKYHSRTIEMDYDPFAPVQGYHGHSSKKPIGTGNF